MASRGAWGAGDGLARLRRGNLSRFAMSPGANGGVVTLGFRVRVDLRGAWGADVVVCPAASISQVVSP